MKATLPPPLPSFQHVAERTVWSYPAWVYFENMISALLFSSKEWHSFLPPLVFARHPSSSYFHRYRRFCGDGCRGLPDVHAATAGGYEDAHGAAADTGVLPPGPADHGSAGGGGAAPWIAVLPRPDAG